MPNNRTEIHGYPSQWLDTIAAPLILDILATASQSPEIILNLVQRSPLPIVTCHVLRPDDEFVEGTTRHVLTIGNETVLVQPLSDYAQRVFKNTIKAIHKKIIYQGEPAIHPAKINYPIVTDCGEPLLASYPLEPQIKSFNKWH